VEGSVGCINTTLPHVIASCRRWVGKIEALEGCGSCSCDLKSCSRTEPCSAYAVLLSVGPGSA
jgi:hypothetical protein